MLPPLPDSRWNAALAGHLWNRAGFGGTPAEVEALAAAGPARAVAQMVEFERVPEPFPDPAWARPDPERGERLRKFRDATPEQRRELQQEENRRRRERVLELQHGWLRRMHRSARPLQEKLTLFWHGHFATSVTKVKDAYLMARQNALFRTQGTGPWLTLLDEVTRDPAMLLWLDQAQSRREHPNENYARELLELFALGEGHYTERDVTEAARALTGLSYDRLRQEPVRVDRQHDPGSKTILGKTGRFDGWDVLNLVVDHPEADRFIAGKLWRFFAGTEPSPEWLDALAGEFRAQGRRFGPFLRALFLSEAFYAPGVVRRQIKSPVQLLVGTCRQLERDLPPPAVCSQVLRRLGQELFNPPNVKGWDGGAAWINTNTLLARHNLALLLVTGGNPLPGAGGVRGQSGRAARRRARSRGPAPVDPAGWFPEADRRDPERIVAGLERRFLQASFRPQQRQALLDYLRAQAEIDQDDWLGVVRLALCTPEYQLA